MKKRLISLALAGVMLLALCACGGGDKPAASTPAASTPAASTPATPATPAAKPGDSDPNWNVTRPEGLPEGYPTKEITYLYPFGSGSTQDVYIRVLAEKIKEMEGWDKAIVVTYKEGAGGDIAWQALMDAKPDGYTFGFAPSAQIITAIAFDREYKPENLDYIFNMMTDPGIIGVHPDSPYQTLEDLLAAAAANPGEISIGGTAPNASEGLAIKQLQKAYGNGCEFTFVPFNSEAEILTAVAGGNCDAFCLNVGDCTTFIDEGSVRVLATGATERSIFYPEYPTYQEAGFNVVQENSRAVAFNAEVDDAIVKYLSDCFVAAANHPDVQAQLANIQIPFNTMSGEETTKVFNETYYADYKALWATDPWA